MRKGKNNTFWSSHEERVSEGLTLHSHYHDRVVLCYSINCSIMIVYIYIIIF